MANYLERVASSAARRAATARPPTSGPPVMPAGRDFTIPVADPFESDQDQFLDPFEAPAPARSAEITSQKREITEESETIPTQAPKSVSSAVPKTPPPHERLSSESPFTVHVPRTLRPISTENVQPTAPTEPPRERPSEEPALIVHSTHNATEVKQSDTIEVETVGPKLTVAEISEEQLSPLPTPRAIEVPVTAPIPRVDRVDGPPRVVVAEPSPPSALPVHIPPVISSATKQEQSRITIGSLEVLVNNHPRITPSRSAPTPSRTERLNLEKRYLDRFRLRH